MRSPNGSNRSRSVGDAATLVVASPPALDRIERHIPDRLTTFLTSRRGLGPLFPAIFMIAFQACWRSRKSEEFWTRAGRGEREKVSGLKKDFGAEIVGVAVWERMLKKLVENGKIVSKRSY